jgi:hypothetical protein
LRDLTSKQHFTDFIRRLGNNASKDQMENKKKKRVFYIIMIIKEVKLNRVCGSNLVRAVGGGGGRRGRGRSLLPRQQIGGGSVWLAHGCIPLHFLLSLLF